MRNPKTPAAGAYPAAGVVFSHGHRTPMQRFFETLPETATAEREDAIVAALGNGRAEPEWVTITAPAPTGDHSVELEVMADALRIEGVRVNVSARGAQRIADLLGALLPTARIADLAFEQARLTLQPCPLPISSGTAAMLEHSRRVDAQIARAAAAARSSAAAEATSALVAPVGKLWVLTNRLNSRPDRAANYGWHFRGPTFAGLRGEPSASLPGVRVIQGIGTRHDAHHVDYSQICWLVRSVCRVDGVARRLERVLADPDLAPLVSHEGPLTATRMPGVAPPTPAPAPSPTSGPAPTFALTDSTSPTPSASPAASTSPTPSTTPTPSPAPTPTHAPRDLLARLFPCLR